MPRDKYGDTYRVHAAHCIQFAQKTDDPEVKLGLLDMASAWLSLADQNEKNGQQAVVLAGLESQQRQH